MCVYACARSCQGMQVEVRERPSGSWFSCSSMSRRCTSELHLLRHLASPPVTTYKYLLLEQMFWSRAVTAFMSIRGDLTFLYRLLMTIKAKPLYITEAHFGNKHMYKTVLSLECQVFLSYMKNAFKKFLHAY